MYAASYNNKQNVRIYKYDVKIECYIVINVILK